jgi:hypothetical protein
MLQGRLHIAGQEAFSSRKQLSGRRTGDHFQDGELTAAARAFPHIYRRRTRR